jgi:hypothetical protein
VAGEEEPVRIGELVLQEILDDLRLSLLDVLHRDVSDKHLIIGLLYTLLLVVIDELSKLEHLLELRSFFFIHIAN